MIELSGRTTLITGASGGIGAAAAYAFAEAGANVVLAARSLKKTEAIAKEIGETARAVQCDVSNENDVISAVTTAVDQFGGLDILINNAGVIEPIDRLEIVDSVSWGTLIDINVKGVFYGIKAALPVMKSAGGGTIISIGSGAARSALEAWSAYCASKAAVHHLHAVLHKEEGENGIRSLVNSPGTVATNMQGAIRTSGINPVSQIPWENHIPPEWVAKTLVWMCGPDADAYLGEVVALRGDELRNVIGV
ncbi:MAG: SDR family oxidoreductase [Pseudomonadota bacterium]